MGTQELRAYLGVDGVPGLRAYLGVDGVPGVESLPACRWGPTSRELTWV